MKSLQLGQSFVVIRINTAGKEMVDLLGPMLATRLEFWINRYKSRVSENLLIYHDGVSERQHEAVLLEELPVLRNICKVMYKELRKITLIVVGKSHYIRIFRKPAQDRNLAFGT